MQARQLALPALRERRITRFRCPGTPAQQLAAAVRLGLEREPGVDMDHGAIVGAELECEPGSRKPQRGIVGIEPDGALDRGPCGRDVVIELVRMHRVVDVASRGVLRLDEAIDRACGEA